MPTDPYNDLGKRFKIMDEDLHPTRADERPRPRTLTVAIDYARLSMNRGRLSDNCDIQHRESTDFIEDHGWRHGASFRDDDISASKYSAKPREDYLRMVHFIETYQPPANTTVKLVIVVTEMERLYRQIEELLNLIKIAERRGTCFSAIWTTDEDCYDLSTPEGIHRAIGAVNNAMRESAKLSRRQRRKKKAQAEQGKWSGGGRPYGYEPGGKIVRASEASVIREIVQRIINGHSLMAITRWLNEADYPTVTGKRWMIGNLQRTILKKRYVISGKHMEDCSESCDIQHAIREHEPENGDPGGEYIAEWPGIITAEDYELMVARMNDAKQPWNHGPVSGRTYVLSGIARCDNCGAPMYGQKRGLPNGTKQRRYRCRPYDNHGMKVGCGKVYRDADTLEAYVFWHVLYRLDTPEMAQALSSKDSEDKAKELAQQLLKLKLRRKSIATQLALADDDEVQDLRVMLDVVRTEQDRVQAALNALQREKTARVLPGAGSLQQAFEKADITGKRTIIQLVYKEVRVKPTKARNKYWQDRCFDEDAVVLVDATDTA